MAESLEKFFNEKLAMMPPEEYEVVGKNARPLIKPASSTSSGDPGEPPTKRGKKAGPVKPRSIAAGKHSLYY